MACTDKTVRSSKKKKYTFLKFIFFSSFYFFFSISHISGRWDRILHCASPHSSVGLACCATSRYISHFNSFWLCAPKKEFVMFTTWLTIVFLFGAYRTHVSLFRFFFFFFFFSIFLFFIGRYGGVVWSIVCNIFCYFYRVEQFCRAGGGAVGPFPIYIYLIHNSHTRAKDSSKYTNEKHSGWSIYVW